MTDQYARPSGAGLRSTVGDAARLGQPRRITSHDWPETTSPLVSIICTTYNHDRFIGEAIEGMLLQETTFPVEIIVHDDASTDETAHIVADYVARYPRLIRAILQKENQRSQGRKAIPTAIPRARGAFIALCEGDDYWTRADKLELQIAALESSPGASGCIHRADARFEEAGRVIEGFFGPDQRKNQYTIDDLLTHGNFVPTASIVIRQDLIATLPEWFPRAPHGDMALLTIAAMTGPLVYIDLSMAVYRKHAAGLHSGEVAAIQVLRSVETFVIIGENLSVSGRDSFRRGLQALVDNIERSVNRYEKTIMTLEQSNQAKDEVIAGIMRSRTFRLGLALSRLRDRLTGWRRGQPADDGRP